ncbi:MAG: hypothetical protein A2216_03690 [Omnitrophica WOR_2 bacterium RIFOXYA2_FULL_45_12]|nr:MAG: hypothetical protein A2216_03690 [Omnitrophica WOR_2 bacterium RIFOXYA2_FULL_45_12]
MPTYKYKAKKGLETTEGRIEAASEKAAVEKLGALGYLPVRLEPVGAGSEPAPTFERRVFTRLDSSGGVVRGRIRSKDITVFSRQLASLLKSGVPILRAIETISEQSENHKLKAILKNVHNSIKDGSTFSSAFLRYPNVFAPIYIAIIRSGEDSGALPEALLRIAEYRLKQEEVISRVRMAMAYPLFMGLVGCGTIVFMLTFVMPKLTRLFSGMSQSLPFPTRMLMTASSFLRQWYPLIIIFLAVFIFVLRAQARTKAGRLYLSSFILRLPLLGKFILKAELGRFSRTLGLLIKNGISILRAIDIAIPALDNEVIKNILRQSHKDLEQGGSFGKSLKKSRLIPVFMSNLIIIGEESGKLDDALAETAFSYERDTDESLKTMANLLEPLMILVMGLIVGFIVVAMLLPVFEMNAVAN